MGLFRNRKDRGTERALRGLRSEAPSEFVDEVASHVRASRPAAPRAWSRAAFASAIAVFMLGTFASFGAIGYAASGSSAAVHAVKRVVVTHKVVKRVTSSAQDQYSKPEVVTDVKQNEGGVAGETTKPSTSSVGTPSGSLPFTGKGLAGTTVFGLILIALGIMLRRREQQA